MPELLFYGGIILMAGTVLAAAAVAVILRLSKKRLDGQLDAEYGKPRR